MRICMAAPHPPLFCCISSIIQDDMIMSRRTPPVRAGVCIPLAERSTPALMGGVRLCTGFQDASQRFLNCPHRDDFDLLQNLLRELRDFAGVLGGDEDLLATALDRGADLES